MLSKIGSPQPVPFLPVAPTETEQDIRVVATEKKIPFNSTPDWSKKNLAGRKLTRYQRVLCFVNRYFMRPLHIFQGTMLSLIGDFNDMSDVSDARIEAFWKRFNDPSKAYLLLYRNSYGEFGGFQHSSLVLGSTEGYPCDNTSACVSWSLDSGKNLLIGGFVANRRLNNFKKDFKAHGEPIVIELPGVNVIAMKAKWEQIKMRTRFYRLLGFNCASVAALLIRKGVQGIGLSDVYKKECPRGFWTPYDVTKLAEGVRAHLV